MENKLNKISGMSLLELMIAMAIFAIFSVAFVSGVGQNIFISSTSKQDSKLVELAETKINELIVSPPDLKETLLEEKPETNKFEEHPGYTYSVVIKKISIPDYAKIAAIEDTEVDGPSTGELEKKAFTMIKEAMEKLVWQIKVTVYHQDSGLSHTIATWIYNRDDEVSIQGGGLL